MRLTDKELELMTLLWDNKVPMTATEIVNASDSDKRSWMASSIYVMLKNLLDKGAVVYASPKPTNTKHARTFKATFSLEDYAVSILKGLEQYSKSGICYDILMKRVRK